MNTTTRESRSLKRLVIRCVRHGVAFMLVVVIGLPDLLLWCVRELADWTSGHADGWKDWYSDKTTPTARRMVNWAKREPDNDEAERRAQKGDANE